MASRKRASHQPEPSDEEHASPAEGSPRGESPVVDKKPDLPSKGKSPFPLMAVMWGGPLLLFLIIAVLKQCVWE
jgi:hypothetical protein